MILALKTDSPTVTLLVLSSDGDVMIRDDWLAERRLARGLLGRLEMLLAKADTSWSQLTGLVVFEGPGSFTGLRIGLVIANSIAYAQGLPIVGVTGEEWYRLGVDRLRHGDNDQSVMPVYGAEARITQPRK